MVLPAACTCRLPPAWLGLAAAWLCHKTRPWPLVGLGSAWQDSSRGERRGGGLPAGWGRGVPGAPSLLGPAAASALWLPLSSCLSLQAVTSLWAGSSPCHFPSALQPLHARCPRRALSQLLPAKHSSGGGCPPGAFCSPEPTLRSQQKVTYSEDNPPAWGTQCSWDLTINSLNEVVLLLINQLLPPLCSPSLCFPLLSQAFCSSPSIQQSRALLRSVGPGAVPPPPAGTLGLPRTRPPPGAGTAQRLQAPPLLRCLPGGAALPLSALPQGWQPWAWPWARPPSSEAARVGVEWFISVTRGVQQGFPELLSPPCCHPPGRGCPAGCSGGAGGPLPTYSLRVQPGICPARGSYGWRGPAGGEVGAAGVAGTARYFSITSRSPFWKWRSAPTVRNPCQGEADQPGAACACAPPGTVPVPPAGPGLSRSCSRTAWLVTTSLVKSMPSGSGICTPFLVLSAGRRRSKQRAPAPAQPCAGRGLLTVDDGHDGELQQGLQRGLQREQLRERTGGRVSAQRGGCLVGQAVPALPRGWAGRGGPGLPSLPPPHCSQLWLGAAQGGWTPPGWQWSAHRQRLQS